MVYIEKIILFFLLINISSTLFTLDSNINKEKEDLKTINSFEELDEIMSQSEFNKIWQKFRKKLKNGEIEPDVQKQFDEIQPENYKENDISENIEDDIILGSSESDSCLLSEKETSNLLKEKYGIINNNPKEEIRFIMGKCHPVILIPGILSTKLQVRINCDKLYEEEKDIFKKVRFFCREDVCGFPKQKPYEEHDLFVTGFGPFQLSVIGDINKYSACLGYFLTFFNSKDVCSPDDDEGRDKNVCNYSKNIKIGYYGSSQSTKNDGKCGLNAIQNVVMVGIRSKLLEEKVNTGAFKYYNTLIKKLEEKGYKAGFSLGGIPNDYRKFLSNNVFTTNAIRYQIENLYKNTGKPVVIIGHSFGTNTMLSNLLKEENSDLLPKIKKFIAVGPPFAGSSQLIKVFFQDRDKNGANIDLLGKTLKVKFDEFGFGMVITVLPTAFELRPLPILGTILNDSNEYKEFGEAIKERLNLEKECGKKACSTEYISQNSEKFDKLFKGYFYSLTDPDCKFESGLTNYYNVFNRKCITEMFNFAECPTIIEEKTDSNGKLPNDFDKYCGQTSNNLYFQQNCGNNNGRNCVDELYYNYDFYPYELTNEKTQYFLNRWNEKQYYKEFGEINDIEEMLPSRDKYYSNTRKQIEYFNEISLTKDLKVPKVDVDIIYSNYELTPSAYIYYGNDLSREGHTLNKGGDGVVSNWSPIITGLKWIYDIQKNNLKNKVRLIEFCSRLAKNTQYVYDPTKEQNFAAISCDCIDGNNMYHRRNSCAHGDMISDSSFIKYVFTVIDNPLEKNDLNEDRYKAYNNFNQNIKYETQCNEELIKLFDSEN